MIIKVLSENTSSSPELGREHGLSLYIQTEKHRLLFDTGASGLFAENAAKMGVELEEIDLAVISHGHYDHGGGIRTFLEINGTAKIYAHQKAFEKHYALRRGEIVNIGLDETLLQSERFVFCGNRYDIDEGLWLLSGVRAEKFIPSGNAHLCVQAENCLVRDDFAHEQNLVISEGDKSFLVAGCAHNGIVNIVDHFRSETGRLPDFVIGGFHLSNPDSGQSERPENVDEIGKILLEKHARYYTCHCTGIESYNRLKTVMGDSISYISGGDQLIINI